MAAILPRPQCVKFTILSFCISQTEALGPWVIFYIQEYPFRFVIYPYHRHIFLLLKAFTGEQGTVLQ